MSNLKLPALDFDSLSEAYPQTDRAYTVAYATTVERRISPDSGTWGHPYFVIRHHGSTIATVGHDFVSLVWAGWDSQTTAARMHKVAIDNALNVKVGIRQHVLSLLNFDCTKIAAFEDLRGVNFSRSPIAPAGWARESLTGISPF